MANVAPGLANFLPAVIFVVAIFLALATGTFWGTFGILIPIIVSMFDIDDPLFIIGISACLSGAVCGDHSSPISDTTIMSSAGAGFTHSVLISLGAGVVLVIATLLVMKKLNPREIS